MISAKEEYVLNILWAKDEPMTSMELLEAIPPNGMLKKDSSIHRILNALLEKGMITVTGSVRSGKLYARQFRPTMTREAYIIDSFTQKQLNSKALSQVALGLIKIAKKQETEQDIAKSGGIDEKFIEELESMISEMEEGKGE